MTKSLEAGEIVEQEMVCMVTTTHARADEMMDEIIIRTRQFARRQTQWFKKETIDLIIEMDNMDRPKLPEILHCIFLTLA